MQNGEARNYPEPLAKAIRDVERAVADAVNNIQHHTQALERERDLLARHEAVLAAYTHAVTLLTESGAVAPSDPPKARRPRRDIVGMVREHIAEKGYVDHDKVAAALGIRPSQAASALIKISAEEKPRAEIPT